MPTNFWTWFWPSIWMSGWNNQQLGGRQQLQKPTKQQKFPWLDADQIKRLESLTSDPQEQQKLYQQAIALKSQRDMAENRIATENELTYRSMQQKDIKQKNYMQSNVRLEQLADLTKQKFWLNADADTQGVINWLMQYAQDKGVSMDSLNDYLAWYNDKFLYETWLKEQTWWEKAWQVATDIVWWAYDSVTSLWRWTAKWMANAVWWTAKQFWADEAKTDELVQSYKDYLDNEMSSKDIWADQESLAYNISKWVWDLTQVVAGEWLIKAWVQSTVKWSQMMNYLKNAPTWQKMVAGGLEWAGDMALYSIVADNKLPSTTEEAIGAGLWAIIPWAWAVYKATKPIVKKALGKTASQLELSGLLNPAKLNNIKNQLIDEWTNLAEAWLKGWKAEDVGTWMIERWFKWDKPTIINDLWEYANKSHNLKREVLSASPTLHDVESAKKSLQVIYDTIKDVPWLEKKLARVEELMAKEKHTLSELDEIKSILDDTKSIYTLAGDAKAWAVNKGLDAVRKDLRKYIEDQATKEWLGNVKMLNNETQIAKWLQDAISRKDSADAAREMLSVFSKTAIGWAAWYNVWPFDTNTLWGKIWNIVVWALAGKYLFSTKAKTNLASMINKMSGWSKKELERLIAGDLSVKKLSNKTQNELAKIFEESGIMEAWLPKEMTPAEYEALLKNYSKSDLPALEFKEWVDDAWKNILAWDSEKIIATPEWVNIREWQIWELPTKNVNYAKPSENNPIVNEKTWETLEEAVEKLRNQWWEEETINNFKEAVLKKAKWEEYKLGKKTLDELIEPVDTKVTEVYHGTRSDVADNILKEWYKPSSELPENAYRGWGYWQNQEVISFATDRESANTFAKASWKWEVLKTEIKDWANVVKIKWDYDAEDLAEYLPELREKGIDAVILDNGENEFVVINRDIIWKSEKAFNPKTKLTIKDQKKLEWSKIVNDEWEPLMMYHWTNANFKKFDNKYKSSTNWGDGFYFISSEKWALDYWKNVKKAYLDVKNPLDLTTSKNDAEYNKRYWKKNNPYDWYIVNFGNWDKMVIVRDASQIIPIE